MLFSGSIRMEIFSCGGNEDRCKPKILHYLSEVKRNDEDRKRPVQCVEKIFDDLRAVVFSKFEILFSFTENKDG